MSEYKPHEIDPLTIHLSVDAPVRENLEGLIYMAKARARQHNCYVMIFHDEERGYAIKSIDREFYEKGNVQCPRQADLNYEIANGKPRPFPSILVTPTCEVVVSKPSLCKQCSFVIRSTVLGCDGTQFAPHSSLVL